MFGNSKIEAYENVIGHLEKHIKRLEDTNKQLLDRLMAKSFEEYQVMTEPTREAVEPSWPIIPVPGTVDSYEAEAHEIG